MDKIIHFFRSILVTLHLNSFHPLLSGLIIASFLGGPVLLVSTAFQLGAGPHKPAPVEVTSIPVTVPITPTDLPTITITPTRTNTPTRSPSPSITFTPSLTFTPTITFTPTASFTPTLTLPAAAGVECVPIENTRVKAKVVRVTDGDTIVVLIDGVEYPLRYIGMDAPESSISGGSLSTAHNRNLVEGKTVTLVKDVSETDRYDRILRYVFVGNVFVNYQMVRDGFATSGSWPPDTSCDQAIKDANSLAKANQLGMWAPTSIPYVPPIVPVIPVAPIVPIQPTMANCDPSYPDVCIPRYPPDLDCSQVPFKRFKVLPPDPHGFDRDGDGIGCET